MPTVLCTDGAAPDPGVVARVGGVLKAGGLAIYPTDTLYALGGRAEDEGATAGVCAAKGRDGRKPLPVVAADVAQARALCASWPDAAGRLAEAFWPGPLSLVVPGRAGLPRGLTAGTGTVAVRVPGLALARALCSAAGPLVATSANRAGEPAPVTCGEALAAVGEAVLIAVDAGPGRPLPSTVVSLTGPEPALLRTGAIPWSDVAAALRTRG